MMIIKGLRIGDHRRQPYMSYDSGDIAAWIVGIRAACEMFVFFSIHLMPVFLLYVIYGNCSRDKTSLSDEFLKSFTHTGPNKTTGLHPWRTLILLAFFCLGLTPIFVH